MPMFPVSSHPDVLPAAMRRMARLVCWPLYGLALVLLAWPWLFWLNVSAESLTQNLARFLGGMPSGAVIHLDAIGRAVAALLTSVPAVLLALVLWEAARIASHAARGVLLHDVVANSLRMLARYALALGVAVPSLKWALAAWLVTLASGQPWMLIAIDLGDVLMLLFGGLAALMAWAIRVGVQLAQENRAFI